MFASEQADHRARGIDEARQRRDDELWRAFGASIGEYREDSLCTDVLVNPDGKVFVDRRHHGMSFTGLTIPPNTRENALYTAAGMLKLPFSPEHPFLECELPGGHRLMGKIPPLQTGASLVVRFHRATGLNGGKPLTYEDLVERKLAPRAFVDALVYAAGERLNAFFFGPTSSGKTTVFGAHLYHIAQAFPGERIVQIERAFELPHYSENLVAVREWPLISSDKLVELGLWERPDRFVWGELKSSAAATLIYDVLSTGHDGGGATIHAKSALGAVHRIEHLIRRANLPVIRENIAEAVNVLIGMRRCEDGERRIVTVDFLAWKGGEYAFHSVDPRRPFEPPEQESPSYPAWWRDDVA